MLCVTLSNLVVNTCTAIVKSGATHFVRTMFLCFERVLKEVVVIFLFSIRRSDFLINMRCVLCSVRNESPYIGHTNFRFGVDSPHHPSSSDKRRGAQGDSIQVVRFIT